MSLDLDDELLGLADGDDSSEGEVNHVSGNEEAHGESDSDAADAAIATAPTPKKRGGRKKKQESEEDDEASPASRRASSPMGASDDGRPGNNTSGPLYPVDGKFISSRDKADIMALPELEREAILAERQQEIIKKQQDDELTRRNLAKKRKAPEEVVTDPKRRALQELKDKRERKGKGQTLEVPDRRRGREPSESISRGDEDSEVEWDTPREKSAGPYDEPAEYVDFYRAQVTRSMMAQHCWNKNFNRIITGCYARIACPPERSGGPPIYRMSRIENVKDDGKSYMVEGRAGHKFSIQKWLVTSVGKAKRDFPITNCSNDKITVNEFNEYRMSLENAGLSPPKKSTLKNKNADLLNMVDHHETQEEIDERLKKSGVAGRKQKQIQISILRRELEGARAIHDDFTIKRLEAELRELGDDPDASPMASQQSNMATEKTEQERLAELNRKARKENVENVRRAQKKELQRKAEQRAKQMRAAKALTDGEEAAESNQEKNLQVKGQEPEGDDNQYLKDLLAGKHDDDPPLPGRPDFAKWDSMYQLGKLSRKKGNRKSIFRRKFFRTEIIAAMNIKYDKDRFNELCGDT